MPINVERPVRAWYPGEGGRVYGLPHPHAHPWPESKRCTHSLSSPFCVADVPSLLHRTTSISPPFSHYFRFGLSDLNIFVGQLTPEQKSVRAVQHALAVQRAMALGNYHKLFQLYVDAPNMGAYIMDHFVERERIRALLIMARSYVFGAFCFAVR